MEKNHGCRQMACTYQPVKYATCHERRNSNTDFLQVVQNFVGIVSLIIKQLAVQAILVRHELQKKQGFG